MDNTLNAIKFNRSSMSLDTAFTEWNYRLWVDKFYYGIPSARLVRLLRVMLCRIFNKIFSMEKLEQLVYDKVRKLWFMQKF